MTVVIPFCKPLSPFETLTMRLLIGPQPKKKLRKQNESFRRVKEEEVYVDPSLADNTYEGTFGASGWGAKASKDLIVTRGKSFRHEKNKRKRGSYRGGEIDIHAVNSTKTTWVHREPRTAKKQCVSDPASLLLADLKTGTTSEAATKKQ